MKTIAQQINWDFEANGRLEIKDKNGKCIYYELSDGFWVKWEHDSQGYVMYYEDSTGYWSKREYDSEGNLIYYEASDGLIIDNRPKTCEDRVLEIDGVKYKLIKL